MVRGEEIAPGDMHLVIHVCIFNSRGQMLIQQRQPWKIWGEYWDVSVGGSVIAGESSREAAHRELLEELGIDMDFTGRRPNFTQNFEQGFDDFYLVNADVDIDSLRLQPEEVKAVRWADIGDIFGLLDEGRFIPFFKSIIQVMFDVRSKLDCLNM
ncbi:MAG: NUDIX domain-containing protein [Oscillospiraceae bacterium]|nr:NUDIX domain-containing protein [Oscillospiraceae bacterium]